MEGFVRPELFDFHGVSMTHFFTDNWDDIQTFQARPDDVVIVSYPKAGNSWVSYITSLLYFGELSKPLSESVITLEVSLPYTHKDSRHSVVFGTKIVEGISSPRIIKTHLPVQFFPKSFKEQNCKMVYVARNAKDTEVSYFHMDSMTLIQPEPGAWSSHLQRFMEGKVVFGSWYDHVSAWWEESQRDSNIHFLFYEDLAEDAGRELDKLCSFLGLCPSAAERERILCKTRFEEMRNDERINLTTFTAMDVKKSPFFRKGTVGDWKNHFTVSQHEAFEDDYRTKMKNSPLKFRDV